MALVREGLASNNGTLRSSSLEGTHVFLCGLLSVWSHRPKVSRGQGEGFPVCLHFWVVYRALKIDPYSHPPSLFLL